MTEETKLLKKLGVRRYFRYHDTWKNGRHYVAIVLPHVDEKVTQALQALGFKKSNRGPRRPFQDRFYKSWKEVT